MQQSEHIPQPQPQPTQPPASPTTIASQKLALQHRFNPLVAQYLHFPNSHSALLFSALQNIDLIEIESSTPEIYEDLPDAIKRFRHQTLEEMFQNFKENEKQIEKVIEDLKVEERVDIRVAQFKHGEIFIQRVNKLQWQSDQPTYIIFETKNQQGEEIAVLAVYEIDKKHFQSQQQEQPAQSVQPEQQEPIYKQISQKIGSCWSCLKSNTVVDNGICWDCFSKEEYLPINKYGKPVAYAFICFVLTLASVMVYEW